MTASVIPNFKMEIVWAAEYYGDILQTGLSTSHQKHLTG